jgi:putative chitinase
VAGNRFEDVKTIQMLLNRVLLSINLTRLDAFAPLTEDGGIGKSTREVLKAFQQQIMGQSKPTGNVAPGDKTLARLREGIPAGFNQFVLQGIMIHAGRPVIEKYFTALVANMAKREINTDLRKAHFLAQLAHESGDFRFSEEIASGHKYEGRHDLGNTHKGDGPKFKGRGLIQLTGRSNYIAYGKAIGEDLTTLAGARTLATNPDRAVDVSCWFWETKELNALADNDDVTRVTRKINGGLKGFHDRRRKLARAKFFLHMN